jgi:hypothetical protein
MLVTLACGLRTKQTGSCYQFPVLHFWATIRASLRDVPRAMALWRKLRPRPFRYPPDVRVFLEQRLTFRLLTFRLQPIIHVVSISAAALNVDLVCPQLNFSTCGMSFGSE